MTSGVHVRSDDGVLECRHCGAEHKIDYPASAAQIIAVLDTFKKEHAECGENHDET